MLILTACSPPHHIPEPSLSVRAALDALKPGGRMLVWFYGKEGNELYLAIVNPLRYITKRVPQWLLVSIIWAIYPLLVAYMLACNFCRCQCAHTWSTLLRS
jgi:hypothetical protein